MSLQFLTQTQTAVAIRKVLADAHDVRLAVAFWGDGAVQKLGGLSHGKKAVRALINLDSGACNPDEITRLSKLATTKSHAKLHAKVYWTPDAVVIGSSNASTNGLWGEGPAATGWREGNLLVRDAVLLKEIGEWFDVVWNEGYGLTKPIIEQSRSLWLASKQRAPSGQQLRASLFEAYRNAPRHPQWGKVKVAFCSLDLTDEGKREADAQIEAERALGGDDVDIYESWNDKFAANDIVISVSTIEAARPDAYDKARISYATAGPQLVQSDTLTYLWERDSLEILPLGVFRLNGTERSALRSLMADRMRNKRRREFGGEMLTLAQVMKLVEAASG